MRHAGSEIVWFADLQRGGGNIIGAGVLVVCVR